MLVNEKSTLILNYLQTHKKASIQELSRAIFASEATVRRCLTDLQNRGLVARYHGGAFLIEDSGEVSLFVRSEQDIGDKNLCANIALGNLPDFNTIFIDNSSTCLTLAKKMDFSNKTIITNGLQIALQLSAKQNIQLIMLGGAIQLNSSAVTGSTAVEFLKRFNIDLALCSCAALSKSGSFELSLETAQLKTVALEQSKYKMLIATQGKLHAEAPYLVSSLYRYDKIITNATDEDLQIIDPEHRLENIVKSTCSI